MTVREQVQVVAVRPVDGTRRRKPPVARRGRCGPLVTLVVDRRVLATAHAVRRAGERLVIVSETRIDLVRAS